MQAVYNPISTYTPSQKRAVADHNIRRAKIAARAVADTPIVLRPPKVEIVPEPLPLLPEETWAERQKRLYRKIKRPWFSIISEGELIEPRRPRLEQIRRFIAFYYGISETILIAHRRTGPVVRARQIAMYLAKTLTLHSLPEIGRRFGNRDHSTVLHSIRKIEALIKNDASFAAEVESIARGLGS